MNEEEKIIQYLRVLCYLKSQSPDFVSRQKIADKFFDGGTKKVETVCKHLIDAKLVSSKPGSQGGYTYDPTFIMHGLNTSDVNTALNEYTYSEKMELNKINLSINNNEVIERLSKMSFAGIPLISDLKINAVYVSPNEEKLMVDITDAIRGTYKIKINYTSSQLNEDNTVNSFDCVVGPINFIIFNGAAYLNAYYYKIKDSKPTGERVLRTYVLNRIKVLKHLENENFAVTNDDRLRIKNKLPYELYDQDNEIRFPIKLHYRGYNCFNRVFKNYYCNDIKIDQCYSIVFVTTKSYMECVGNLLALGNTFEFIDSKECKPVKDLYSKTLEDLREKLKK